MLSTWFQSQTSSQLEEEEEKKGDLGVGLVHLFVHNGAHWDFWIWTQASMKHRNFNIQALGLVWIYLCALNCLCVYLKIVQLVHIFWVWKTELKMWPTVSFCGISQFQFLTETRNKICMFQDFGCFSWKLELVGNKDKEVQMWTCLNGHGCHLLSSFLDSEYQ